MKLHAIQDRKDDRKRASDPWDLFGLIDLASAEREFSDQIAAAPPGLLELVGNAIERIFRRDVTRTRRRVQVLARAPRATSVPLSSRNAGHRRALADSRNRL